MSIQRWHAYIEDDDGDDLFVSHQQDVKGGWVRYDDHAAEVERLQARERELEAALRAMFHEYEGVFDMAVPSMHQSDGAKRAEALARAALAAVSAETEDDDG